MVCDIEKQTQYIYDIEENNKRDEIVLLLTKFHRI